MSIILLCPVKKQLNCTTNDSQPNLTSYQIFQLDGQPHEVKQWTPRLASESVAQLCYKIWAQSWSRTFLQAADHTVPLLQQDQLVCREMELSYQQVVSDSWEHQQQQPPLHKVLREPFVLAGLHSITHSCHLIFLAKINSDLLKQSRELYNSQPNVCEVGWEMWFAPYIRLCSEMTPSCSCSQPFPELPWTSPTTAFCPERMFILLFFKFLIPLLSN